VEKEGEGGEEGEGRKEEGKREGNVELNHFFLLIANRLPTPAQEREKVELTLLSSTVENPILGDAEVDLDELSSGEELNDHSGRDDGSDSELHEGSPAKFKREK